MLTVVRRDERADIARTFADPRLELVRLLHEAAEIEHALCLQYLYAAYALRPRFAALAGPPEAGGTTLLGVAIQEMAHLRDVNRLLVELGAAPSLGHQDLPYEPGIYPFPMALEPLSRASLAKYLYAEAPRGAFAGAGGAALEPALAAAALALLPGEPRANHVGSLYGTIGALLAELPAGDTRLVRWRATIAHIRQEGETDHFQFFRALFAGTHPAFRDRPPCWDDPDDEGHPSFRVAPAPATAPVARLGNHAYWAMLLLLDAGYRDARADAAVLRGLAARLMREVLHPVGRLAAARGLGLRFDPLTIGHAPGVDARRSLELAATLLAGGAALAPEAADTLGAEAAAAARDALETAARRIAWAVRDGSPAVLVAGAGPAGLAAAAALARRGVSVRVVEAAPVVGGKAYSLRTRDGRSIEHGVHGWWPTYRNFDRLLAWAGVAPAAALRPAARWGLQAGRRGWVELRDLPVTLPSPFFLVGHLLRAPFLGVRDALSLGRFAAHALAFRHEADYARYDGVSLAALAADLGVSEAAERYVLRPFALCFDYAPPERVSAASVLSALQLYVLPWQQAARPRWSRGLPQEAIFGPLAHAIAERGGRVDRGAALDTVVIADGAVTGAWVVEPDATAGPGGTDVVAEVPLAELPDTGLRAVTSDAGPLLVGRVGGEPCAYSARCPHAGGLVEPRGTELVCRRHGGAFDLAGRPLRPPPAEPLAVLPVRRTAETLQVLGTRRRTFVPCSHVVVATDLPRARAVLERSPGVPPALVERLRALRTTPIVVVRLWFRAGTPAPPLDTIVLTRAAFGDVFFNLNAIDPSHDAEGVVLELHACDPDGRWTSADDETVLGAALDTLRALEPALRRDALCPADAWHVQRHAAAFTLYAPGAAALRPGVATGVAGLALAGDWTAVDRSAWMMERAVVSGLHAANRVLDARGLGRVAVAPPPADGPVLAAARWLARLARWLLWPEGASPAADPSPDERQGRGVHPPGRAEDEDLRPVA